MEGDININPYQSPMNNYGSAIILMTDPSEELRKLEMSFRNEVELEDGNTKKIGDSLMNEEGITSIMGQIKTAVNRVTIMSNLEAEEIESNMFYLADGLARDLMINRLKYDIRNFADRTVIYRSCLRTAFICMKRSKDGDDKRFWKGSVQEIYTKNDAQKSGGLFSGMLGWRR